MARETLGWIKGVMSGEEGGFYSAQDADTSQGEGTYYTWTPEELEKALSAEDASALCRIFGVTRNGNFEGRTLLHLEPGRVLTEEERRIVAKSKPVLYSARVERPRPATDTKVMTSWNGLAISALAFSSVALGNEGFIGAARGAADFVLRANIKNGRLLRRYAGGEAALEGTLEDYAFFVQALLDLFEASSEPRWLKEATRLTRVMVEDYEDRLEGGFFLSLAAEPARLKESYDGPTPSGNSVAAMDLVRLAELTGDEDLRKAADRTLRHFAGELESQPSGHTTMLAALDLLLSGAREVVITAPTSKAAREMKEEALSRYMPDRTVITATAETYDDLSQMSTLLEGRKPGKKARAFVCQNFACKLPADTVGALRRQLSPAGR